MKNHYIRILNLVLFALSMVSISCEKVDTEYNNEDIVIKSQEIIGYTFESGRSLQSHSTIIPCKLYVKGGMPEHEKGDYLFKIAKGSSIPEGIFLDSLTGVIDSDKKLMDLKEGKVEFDVTVTDGHKSTTSQCILNIQKPAKVTLPVFQFNSPETNLISNFGSEYFAASFSVMGGEPPYSFSLADKSSLPGKLSLNPSTGVIAGDVSKIDPGEYHFRLVCTDSKSNKAISFCTAANYEDFYLIIR